MDPESDFPAAHSMDTNWYAVDRDGHVALFASDESGAVPETASTEDNDVSREDLAAALPEAPYRLLDWLGESREEHHRELPDAETALGMGPTLMFLTSLDAVSAEIVWIEHEPASEGVAVRFEDLPVATAWRLHEAGACLGCFPWPSELGYDLFGDLPRRLGLYYYDQSTDNWIAGPYVRGRPPERPLHIDQLPAPLRDAVGRFRFQAVRFSETERIQPVDHAPCAAWGDAYLDLDGRTVRPIPGREGEFRAEDWAGSPEFQVEVPGRGPIAEPPREGGG